MVEAVPWLTGGHDTHVVLWSSERHRWGREPSGDRVNTFTAWNPNLREEPTSIVLGQSQCRSFASVGRIEATFGWFWARKLPLPNEETSKICKSKAVLPLLASQSSTPLPFSAGPHKKQPDRNKMWQRHSNLNQGQVLKWNWNKRIHFNLKKKRKNKKRKKTYSQLTMWIWKSL